MLLLFNFLFTRNPISYEQGGYHLRKTDPRTVQNLCFCPHLELKKRKKMKKTKKTTEIIEKRKNQEITLPQIINTEVNLLIFPFFALHKKGLKKKLETEYRDVIEREGQKIEVLWNVSANPKYGYPGLFDRQVHKAIEQIITEILRKDGKIENPICLGSLYNLCKKMGIKKFGGREYREIKNALERIRATTIKSEGAFYQKKKKQWISKSFGLYDGVVFKGEQLEDGTIADTNFLYLGDLYLQSINSFYIKPIDYNYLQSLKSKIASRLYEILGVKFYGLRNKKEDFICYRYSKLCQLLPITPFKQISRAKQQLNPAHKELKDTGFLSDYDWDKDTGKDWLIYYWPGERAKKEMRRIKKEFFKPEEVLSEPEESPTLTKSQIDLVNQLVALNVSKVTAEDLVKHSDEQAIKTWIKAIHYTKAKDKAAYLVKAIKERWQLPEEYLRKEEEERKRKEKEKRRLAKEKKEKEEQERKGKEAQKLDKIYNSLSSSKKKKIEEEVIKRLPPFWQGRLRKERERLSKLTKSALDKKRREVIREWIKERKIREEVLKGNRGSFLGND